MNRVRSSRDAALASILDEVAILPMLDKDGVPLADKSGLGLAPVSTGQNESEDVFDSLDGRLDHEDWLDAISAVADYEQDSHGGKSP